LGIHSFKILCILLILSKLPVRFFVNAKLDKLTLSRKANDMDNEWVSLHLQTIRTLMERSALYRRALAPISIFVGTVGVIAAIAGWALKIEAAGTFALYWMCVSVVAVVGALSLVRGQAVKQGENFWSPPTRRVVQAMFPPLLIGLVFGLVATGGFQQTGTVVISMLLILWTLLYGLGLHAAGFFMPRGIRLFGWGFIIAGLALMGLLFKNIFASGDISPHWAMGILFGASHLAYGVYLYFTEQRKNET